ncbi:MULTISPECIES: STAS domain-containing protein [unclassified Streptomyces]|uniref:STAS domain-containing protein n=1 Tax=unclassified Streptomyces TaxID=2593676 RepID=UPI00344B0551
MTDTEHTVAAGGLSALTSERDGIRVISLQGEIDHHSGPVLQQALHASKASGPRVVLDLRGVLFMDSTGVNLLISAHGDLTRTGGWLRLAAPTPAVLRPIRLVGLDALVECHPTLSQALHS